MSLDLVHGEQGSSDYSEYGYEPEYEMQSENPPDDEELLKQWRLERWARRHNPAASNWVEFGLSLSDFDDLIQG